MPATENPTRALPTLHEFFAPGGILAHSPLPYEYRPGQLEMAKAVERALEERRHLIVEAGTGTGKTLAYLLPALRTGQRIIVSTGTKALQDQLYFRDIPFLETLVGSLHVCYMKGRANYLCRHKLVALRNQPILSGLEEIDQYRQIAEWEQTTETGDRAEIAGLPESSALWQKLDARAEACLGTTCPDYRRCFITEMRRKALESDIIIVNHHLFFADLSVKREAAGAPDAGILPEAAAVVFDEAHELEEVASSYFGLSVSNIRFEELARDTDVLLRGKEGAGSMPALTQQLRERARIFFAGLPMSGDGRQPFTEREEFLEISGDLYMAVRATLQRMEAEMDGMKGVDEAPGLRKRVTRLRSELEFLLESSASNMVYWMERRIASAATSLQRPAVRSASRTTFLQATPIDVSELLSELVFDQIPTVVMTSATLTVQGGFEHIRKRLGLERGARVSGAFALSLWRTGAALSAAGDARPARTGVSRGRGSMYSKGAGDHSRPRLLSLYELCPDARLIRAPDACAGLSHPAARHGAAQSASGAVPHDAECGTLRHFQFLAGRGRAGRGSELRHHRPPALRRAQRPGGCRAHEGHRRGRRQALLRLPGSFGRAYSQAGLRPAHSLA